MCHQAIEKILKAYFVATLDETPPYTHNVKVLAEKSGLMTLLSKEQLDLLDELMPMNIEARYPTYKELLMKSLTEKRCRHLIINTEKLCNWIKLKL